MKKKFIKQIELETGLSFNQDQSAAINHFKGPALTLAVPGSGKTTLLLTRTLNLIESHKVDPKEILTITFSKASARDMQHRYKSLFKSKYLHDISFSTIHSFAFAIYRAYCKKKKIPFKLLENTNGPVSKLRLFRDIYLSVNKSYPQEDKLEEMSNAISYIKNMMIEPDGIKSEFPNIKNLDIMLGKYDDYKRSNNMIDFDDMLTDTYKILLSHKEALKYYQSKFPFIQVDETQDTSKIQHKLIQLLAGDNSNVFMVADDDQSIYGFRGAFPDFLLNFDKTYTNGKTYYLKTNYRSDKNIIDICNHTIKNNINRYPKVISPFHKRDGNVTIINFDTLNERNKYMIDEISKTRESIGVLYRNNLSGITIANSLEIENQDFLIRDNKLNLFTHWITKDIKSILSLALVPQDLEAFEKICYKVNAFISKKQLEYVKLNHRGRNIFSVLLENTENSKRQIKTIQKLEITFAALIRKSPLESIIAIEEELGYLQYLNDRAELMGYSFNSLMSYISALKEIAVSTDSIVDFFDRLDHLKYILKNSLNNYSSHIRLSTIHSSKGLEYSKVFIVDVEDSVFPNASAVNKASEGDLSAIEEERRLFYVALSRAKHDLIILNVKFKNGTYIKPSLFIKDLDSHASLKTIHFKSKKGCDTSHLIVGSKVSHKTFGIGEIIDSNKSITKIAFDHVVKELSTPVCIEKKLIRYI
ncbi:MAG: ATP-dependent helicase [Acidaminobacteraceae bacterium]